MNDAFYYYSFATHHKKKKSSSSSDTSWMSPPHVSKKHRRAATKKATRTLHQDLQKFNKEIAHNPNVTDLRIRKPAHHGKHAIHKATHPLGIDPHTVALVQAHNKALEEQEQQHLITRQHTAATSTSPPPPPPPKHHFFDENKARQLVLRQQILSGQQTHDPFHEIQPAHSPDTRDPNEVKFTNEPPLTPAIGQHDITASQQSAADRLRSQAQQLATEGTEIHLESMPQGMTMDNMNDPPNPLLSTRGKAHARALTRTRTHGRIHRPHKGSTQATLPTFDFDVQGHPTAGGVDIGPNQGNYARSYFSKDTSSIFLAAVTALLLVGGYYLFIEGKGKGRRR